MSIRNDKKEREEKEFSEKVVSLNRVAKVVKGGRRFSFSALVVVGDGKGRVGYGFGKANDVSEAIRKSVEQAKRSLRTVPVFNNTIPHEVIGRFKSSSVIMKPAAPGTGIIAGGSVRLVMEAVGIGDVLGKRLGSKNSINIVKAVFAAFDNTMNLHEVSTARGKSIKDFWG